MDYVVFFLICLATTLSPGPAMLLVVKNAARYGFLNAMSGIGGNVAAMVTLAALSAAGLGAIILASETLFTAIKIVGGVYLIYLGLKAWLSKTSLESSQGGTGGYVSVSRKKLFIESYFVGVSNPKAIAFFTALFPQFIDINQAVVPQFFVMAFIYAACSLVCLSFYAVASKRISKYLLKEKINKIFHRVTGGIFIGFGATLILSNKS